MQKIVSLLLALMLFIPADIAVSAVINGELKKAQLEKLSADPSSSEARVYYNTTSKKPFIYNGTAWTGLGGGGVGEINVIQSPDNAVSWSSTGAGVTVATTTTAGDLPLGGIITSAIKITPVSGTTDYAYYCWTMPAALKNRKLKWQWEQRPHTSYVSGDLKSDIYSYATASCGGAATRVALSTDSSSVTSIPSLTGRFTTTFDADSSDYYGIRYTRVAGTSPLHIASVIVGPGIQPQGAVVGEWASFTPVFATGLPATTVLTGYKRRVGDSLEVEVAFTANGAGTGELEFTLPDSLAIDTTKAGAGTSAQAFGSAYFNDAGVSVAALNVRVGNSASGAIFVKAATGAADTIDGPEFGAGDNFGFRATLPIATWSGSGTVNLAQNDVEFASNSDSSNAADTTSFAYGPSGSTGVMGVTNLSANRRKRVAFASPIQSTDLLVLEIFPNITNAVWTPLISANSAGIGPLQYQNGNAYGIGMDRTATAANQLDVIFGQHAYPSGATYGASGLAWNDASMIGYKWRVRKVTGGSAVGFGLATSANSGLIPRYEKGACTPSWSGGAASGGTQLCRYVKIGSTVCIETTWASFNTDASDTITGTLPFAAKTASTYPAVYTNAGTVQMGRFITTAGSTLGSPTSSLTSTAFTGVSSNNTLNVNVCYEVNE